VAWFEIDIGGDPPARGTLVCDATAAAGPLWAGPLLSVLEAFAEGPPANHPDVVFLGGRTAHPLADILRRAADPDRLADEELNRGAALGPWAAWATPRPTVVALLAGTTVLDLGDYVTAEWLRHLRVYRFLGGDTPNTAGVAEFGPADLDAAVEFLSDPPTSLTVGGPGGVVLDWSPDGAAGWDQVTWATPPGPAAGGPVRVEFHHPDDAPPTATLTRRSGSAHPCRVTPVAAPPAEAGVPLPPAAETLLSLWGRGLAWACDRCHAAHAPGFARCVTGEGSLLPTLPADRLWSVRARPGGRVAVPVARGLLTATGDALRLGPRGVECRRPDGAVESCDSLFQQDAHGGRVVRT